MVEESAATHFTASLPPLSLTHTHLHTEITILDDVVWYFLNYKNQSPREASDLSKDFNLMKFTEYFLPELVSPLFFR